MDTHLTLLLHLQTYKILNVPVRSTTERQTWTRDKERAH